MAVDDKLEDVNRERPLESTSVRMNSIHSAGSNVSSLSVRSSKNALILSEATSTATIAARSILASGGTEATALKTAKAAAQAVLADVEEDASDASSRRGVFGRRKIKRQADVVASMALVSAANTVLNGAASDCLTMSDAELAERFRMFKQQRNHDGDSVEGSVSSPRTTNSRVSRFAKPSLSPVGSALNEESDEDDDEVKESPRVDHAPNAPPVMGEPKKSEPETKQKKSSLQAPAENSKMKVVSSPAASSSDKSEVTTLKKPSLQASAEKNSKMVVSSPTASRGEKSEVATALSSDDPIYYIDTTSAKRARATRITVDATCSNDKSAGRYDILMQSASHDTQHTADSAGDLTQMSGDTGSVASQDYLSQAGESLDEMSRATAETQGTEATQDDIYQAESGVSQDSFLGKHVDPLLFLSNFISMCQCTPTQKTLKQEKKFVDRSTSDVSSVASDELLRGLRDDDYEATMSPGRKSFRKVLEKAANKTAPPEQRDASLHFVQDPDCREGVEVESVCEDLGLSGGYVKKLEEVADRIEKKRTWFGLKKRVGVLKRSHSRHGLPSPTAGEF